MKQLFTDTNMPLHALIGDCLRADVRWSRTNAPEAQWCSQVGPKIWTVRVNDFPEEHLYTLFVNGEALGNFDDWPSQWFRDEDRRDARDGAGIA